MASSGGGCFLPGDPPPSTSQTLTTPAISGSTVTSPTLTSPTITGTTSIGAGATITSPTITAPTVTTGTFTTPTLATWVNSDYKVLAATATYSATVTPATLTGFSWTVVAGSYIFELNLPTTMTTVGGLTVNFGLTTAVLTSIQYQTYAATAADNSTAVSTQGSTTTSATKVFDSKTAAYTTVKVWGSMVVGTGGTFAWYGCQNTSASGGDVTTLPIGAYSRMTRVV